MHPAVYWLILNILFLMISAFYSMQEMAVVSFNKIRLQYYTGMGKKRAEWLTYLLQHPSRLYGTTLLGVNAAMIAGSECSRQFYESLGFNPNIAPLTQVIIAIAFGELAPMFGARRHAEHVALLGSPILYGTAKIFSPFLWILKIISRFFNRLIGGVEPHAETVLNQEDLQKLLGELDEDFPEEENDADTVALNIFRMKSKDIASIMQPLSSIPLFPSNVFVSEVRKTFQKDDVNYAFIYNRFPTNIVSVLRPRNLLKAPDTKRAREYADSPWFITRATKVMQILQQFRRKKETIAVVLNEQGQAIGVLTQDLVLNEIFGISFFSDGKAKAASTLFIDRTFPGNMKVADFNVQFDVILDKDTEQTLAQLITRKLGHVPEEGEFVYIQPFELTVTETSFLGVKKVSVTTRT